MKAQISVVIPLFNEEDGVKRLVNELHYVYDQNPDFELEFVFVNDGSSDDTVNALNEEEKKFKYKIISFSKNFGSHAALRAGILHATYDLVTFMYADLQDPPSLIFELYNCMDERKADIVWATRRSDNVGLFEGVFSRFYAKLMKRFALKDFPKKGFDIVFFNKKVKDVLNDSIVSNSSIFLHIMSLGFKQFSISYDKRKREIGESKWTFSKKVKLVIDSFVSFSYAPLKIVSILGVLMFMCGSFYSCYIVFRKIFVDDLDQGWPTLISVLLLGFGITNISLGIIAEYLWRTFDAARKTEVFIIDEIITEKNTIN